MRRLADVLGTRQETTTTQMGAWDLTDAHALKLREYLLRAGFPLCDSYCGTVEWQGFVRGMIRIFPDRPIIELPGTHPIFHAVYALMR